MSYCTLFLLYLFTILEYSHALDPSIQVTSGVFMTTETNLDYVNATTICKNYENSTLASMDKVQVALKNGYEACRWGWIQEENLVMLRITMSPNCSNNSLGLITKNCVARKSEYTYCIKNGVSNLLYDASLEGPNSNFTEATLTCLMNGDTVPTLSAIQTTSNRNITFNRYAWYNWGVGLIAINGTFQNMPCYYGSQAGAFCYNPNCKYLQIYMVVTICKVPSYCTDQYNGWTRHTKKFKEARLI
ncbi:lymphatic vessel endothelial hyaluronic acid receptor 1 [Pelobates cultripes]|uniref:Lymphatic vessel endothelial hyaluronic acid receptor 1 n=1 Tax=Pelobates cultripes TaxID=61616 RepID=A0AAD1TFI1_PELCU|nr:lymphatic vessel endothelial hyaluronic acid receptor 1 [Pelobates cultripes]